MASRVRFGILLVSLVSTPLLARAQETTTGTLAGQVLDSQELAMPGATVAVASEQGTRTFVSDATGHFLVPYLTPGLYTVRVEMQGFVPVEQRDIKVRLGQRLELRFVMQPGAMTEEVNVLASPIIDLSSATAGSHLDDQLISSVPVGRRFTDVLYIAPGVNSGGGTGDANASISGASGLENNYVLDGVNISDVGYGAAGSYSTQHGTPGNAIVFDFIKEIEIKTAGFEAEFGQSTGGIVNVVTKSGTNAYKGSVFTYLQPEALASDRERITTANGTVNATGATEAEGGFTLGGPIVRDKLFFFAAADLQHERVSFVAPAGFPLASLGEVPRKRRTVSYAAKATYQMSTAHRFETSFFGDPSSGENGPQRASALRGIDTAAFSEINYGGHYQTIRYDGMLSPRWLVEASVSRSDSKVREHPSVDEWRVTDTTVVPNVITGGIGGYDVEQGGVRNQYQVKSTHNLGRHQIRYGALFEDITFDSENQSTGPTLVLPTGERTATAGVVRILPDPVFGRVYAMQGARTANVRETSQSYLSLFAQDTIKIGNRLTLRPGVRWEQQELTGVGGGYTFTGNWSPRIGATFDPTGSGRSKLYANFGRFYTQFPNDLAARGFTALASHQADYFDAALTRPIPDGVLAAGTRVHYRPSGANPADVVPGSKSTYIQEWLAGGEYEVVRGLSLGLRYIHRDLRNVLEDMAPAAAILYDAGIARGIEFVIGNPRDGFPATLNNIGAFETPIHEYDAVEFTVDRRFANRWALQASYRWSRLFGTYEGFYRNDNNQSDPGLTSLYDLPINDPTYTEIGVPRYGYRGDIRFLGRLGAGPLPTDRPHQAKVFGNYRFGMGLNLGVGFQGSSGVPLTAFAASPTTGNAGNIPEGPRGSGVQTVDGFKKRTPAEFALDLHVDHPIGLGNGRLVVLADIFNVLNGQAVTGYDYRTENRIRVPNPDYGARTSLQLPRQVRVGVRYEF
jgi:hypothetical protein